MGRGRGDRWRRRQADAGMLRSAVGTMDGPGRGLGTGRRLVGTRVGAAIRPCVGSLLCALRRAGFRPGFGARAGRCVEGGRGWLGLGARGWRFGWWSLARCRGGGRRRRGGTGLDGCGCGLGYRFAASRLWNPRHLRDRSGLCGGRGWAGWGGTGRVQWKLRRRPGSWRSCLLFGSCDFRARGWRAGGRVAGPTRG